MNIFLYNNPTLSSIAALWALRRYSDKARVADVKTHAHSWNGKGFRNGDVFIGKLFQFDSRTEHFKKLGAHYAGFSDVLLAFAPEQEKKTFLSLATFLDAELPHIDPARALFTSASKDTATIGQLTNILSIYECLKLVYSKNCIDLLRAISPILEGYPLLLKKKAIQERELKNIILTPCGRIAHSTHSQLHPVHDLVFEQKSPCVIIFEYHNFLGAIAHPNEPLPMNHLGLIKMIKEAGEESKWTHSPCGRILSHGTPEHPPIQKSKITSGMLAGKISQLLKKSHKT
jgi:hypothetical protein